MSPVLALIIANIIWGAASPIFKLALTNIPPFTLAFLRFFCASFLLLPFALRRWKQLSLQQLWHVCLGAFFGITINVAFFFLGIEKTASINAPIIASAQPIFLYLISIFFLHERPRTRVMIGIFPSFVGVMTIVLSPLFFHGGLTGVQKETALMGNLFLIIATAGSVLESVIHKKAVESVDWIQTTYLSFLFGALTFVPFSLTELSHWNTAQLNGNGWLGILFGIFFSSALGYGLFMFGISKISAQEIGIFAYIDPVIAVILAVPLLHEYPNIFFFMGTFFVLIGIVVAEGRLHWHPLHRLRKKRSVVLSHKNRNVLPSN
jgi:drug/metabolite transporter (DMT)-like permease